MKIALLGYGKMGKEIGQIAADRGHEIVLKISSGNSSELNTENLTKAEVAIDFSRPDTVMQNMELCFKARVPLVVGTTGWYDHIEKIKSDCLNASSAMVYASNFSPGVQMLFGLNRMLAQMMESHPEYKVAIEEIHHTRKLDAPSGTAITLINEIRNELSRISNYELTGTGKSVESDSTIPVTSIREGEVTGTHTVRYTSAIDRIEIRHEAFNRKGFALGAVMAAEWIIGKKGFFTMNDVLNIH